MFSLNVCFCVSATDSVNEEKVDVLNSLSTKVQGKDFLFRKAADYSRLLHETEVTYGFKFIFKYYNVSH